MNLRGTRLLAESDDGHLGATRFDWAGEARVRLDAIDGQDAIGASRMAIEVQRHARRGPRHLHRVHRRPNLPANHFLGYAQAVQHGELPFGLRSPMTTHRRNNKWLGTQGPQSADRAAQ